MRTRHERGRARQDCDVLVVGSGMGGMAAALAAARAGKTVTVVEKLDAPGGSASIAAGMFWTAPDLESYRARVPLGDVRLAARVLGDYPAALAEIRAMGVRVADEVTRGVMTFGAGYSLDIQGFLERARQELEEAGSRVLLATQVRELIRDDSGVIGAAASTTDGGVIEYNAGAVVLATGGFQGDPAELTRSIGRNADRLVFRSNPGSVGDGLRLARSAGAAGTRGMSTFYGHLVPYPLESFGPEDFLPLTQYYSGSAVLVNLRGERVADETLGDEILNQALTFEPEARGVLIFDERVREVEARKEIFPGFGAGDRFEGAVRAGGTATSAATLEALLATVATWGVDERRLSATVHEYLHVAGSGGGFAHGIAVSPHARPPRVAPFHALMVQPSITFTFGGIRVGLDGEVLDSDERAIPGLFACGVDVGGLSNYGYVGGLAPSYITGRAAGAAAARYSQRGSATEPRKESR